MHHSECASFIMLHKIFDILHKYHLRLVVFHYTSYVKKKRTACIFKTKPFATDRECLTRKTSAQDIVRRNLFSSNLGDVARGHHPKIREISFLGWFIPF